MKCFPGDEAEFVDDAVINQQPLILPSNHNTSAWIHSKVTYYSTRSARPPLSAGQGRQRPQQHDVHRTSGGTSSRT